MQRLAIALLVVYSLLGTPTKVDPDILRQPTRPQLVNEASRGDEGRVYLGVMEVTAYTANEESTDKGPGSQAYRVTASGAEVKEGRTCAAAGLPFGTRVFIEDVGVRVVEDRGALNKNQIDVFMEDIDRALTWGRKYRKAWVIKE